MSSTQSSIRSIETPDDTLLGDNHIEFLKNLGGPAWITVKGRDSTKRRLIITLLHGNEPSGLKAVHQLLKARILPATDLGILIASVDAALHEPVLSHRYIPGERDLNRCFKSPFEGNQGQLAKSILALIADFAPEAVVDTHNTSSHSEPFAIAVRPGEAGVRLAGLFCQSLIILNQRLGIVLDNLAPSITAITVEFGGFMDPNADELAMTSLDRFVRMPDLSAASPNQVNILTHPFRLETERHLTVTYASSIDENADLTIINTIDQLNFRRVAPGTPLGWFKSDAHRNLVARDDLGSDQYAACFSHENGVLSPTRPMTIFMATTDPVVANTDCLLYFTLLP